MPFIAKLCAIGMLVMLVRCPVVAQQMCSRYTMLSSNCTEGNSLIKQKLRTRTLLQRKQTYLSAGINYSRAITIDDPVSLTLEKQYRVGIPVLAGWRYKRYSL